MIGGVSHDQVEHIRILMQDSQTILDAFTLDLVASDDDKHFTVILGANEMHFDSREVAEGLYGFLEDIVDRVYASVTDTNRETIDRILHGNQS